MATANAINTIPHTGRRQADSLHSCEQHHIRPSSHSNEDEQGTPIHCVVVLQWLEPALPQHTGLESEQSSLELHVLGGFGDSVDVLVTWQLICPQIQRKISNKTRCLTPSVFILKFRYVRTATYWIQHFLGYDFKTLLTKKIDIWHCCCCVPIFSALFAKIPHIFRPLISTNNTM
jgi:hypothetical protein